MVLRHMSTAMHRQIQSTWIHTMETPTIYNRNSNRYVIHCSRLCSYFFLSNLNSKQIITLIIINEHMSIFSNHNHSSRLLHSNQLQRKHTIQLHIRLHHRQMLFTLANTWSILVFKISSVRTKNVQSLEEINEKE